MDRDHEGPYSGYLYGSNDGFSTFQEIHRFAAITLPTTSGGVQYLHTVSSSYTPSGGSAVTLIPYNEYRLQVTHTQESPYLNIALLEFYGHEEVGAGDDSVDTTAKSVYNAPDLTSAALYIDATKPDSNESVTDQSGSGVTVTAVGVTHDSTENAWELTGAATSNIVSGNLASLVGDHPHSVSAWVKADVLNGDGLFHVGTAEGEGDAASRVGFVDDSHISYGGADHFFSNAEWHNVTYTYNGEGSNKKLYLDGRLVGTAKNEDTFGDYPPFAMSTYSQGGYVVSTGDPEHDGGQYIWKAFDGDVSTFWFSHPGSADADSTYLNGDPRGNAGQSITDSNGTTHTGSWGKIEFPHKFVLNYLEVQGGTPASAYYPHNPNNYVILGSNDDEVWDLLSTRTGASPTSDGMTTGGTQIDRHTVNAQKAYKYIIFLVTQINTLGGGREFIIAALRLYGHRENDLVRFPDSVNTLKYPHVAMTGPAQRGYVATASSYRTVGPGDYRPHKAFNKVFNAGSNQGWNNQNTLTEYNGTDYLYNGSINLGTGAQNGEWIKLELPRKILMTSMTLYSRDNDPTRAPEDFIVYGSNDDSNWSELLSEVGATPADTGTTYTADTATTYYKYFALVVRRITGQNNYFSIDNIEYIGTEEDLDVVARVGDGYDGKVRNLRVYSTALSDARVQEIFDADKDELGLAKSSVSVYRGHLGVGTTEPKAALTVMDEVGELIQLPPGNMTAHDQYFEKHGVFKARTSPGHNTGSYPPWEGFNDTIGTLWYTGYSDSSASYNGTSGAYSGTAQLGSTTKLGEYLVLEMPYKVFPKRMEYIRQSSGSHLITNAYVYGRNGSNGIWTEIGSFTDGGPPDDWVPKVVHLNNSEPYDQLAFVPTKRYAASTSAGVSCHLVRYFGARERGASTLHNGELSLTRNLTVPRIGPPLDADDTPHRDRLVVEYNTSTNPTANGTVKDTSGRGLDGLIRGSASYDATEKAFDIEASSDIITTGTNIGGVSGDFLASLSVWIKPGDVTSASSRVIFIHTSQYAIGSSFVLYMWEDEIVAGHGSTNNQYVNGVVNDINRWYHIVAIKKGTGTVSNDIYEIYINGVKQTLTTSAGTVVQNVGADQAIIVGSAREAGLNTEQFIGKISNLKYYPGTTLTATEVKRLYDMGRCDEGHHVVNFSKTRVGIGLGDGEAPRAALDVRDLCEIKQLGVGMIGTGIHRPSIAPLSVCKDTFDELGGGIELMRTNTPEGNSGLGFNRGSAIWHAYKSSTNRETLYFAIGGGNYGTSSYDYNRVRGYIDTNNGGGNITFTGQHRAVVEGTPLHETEKYQGLIVSAKNNKYVKLNNGIETGSSAITINESVPLVSLSSVAQDKSCFGVISDSEDPDVREDRIGNFVTTGQKEKGDHRWFINSVGEGAIWVADMNGPLESGDYITTSNIAGYGQKQDGAGLMNYTAAKITMDCDFEPATQPIQCIKQSNVVETHYTGLVPVVKGVPHEFVTTTVTADDEWSNVSVSPSDVTYTEWSNLEANVQNTYTLTYTQTSNVVYDVKYTKTTTANVTAEDAWDAVHIEPPSVTYAEYSNLEANVQNTYSLTYTMTTKVEATEAIYSNLSTEDKEFFVPTYYQLVEQTVDAEYPGAVKHETVTDRLENALDEHGQLQWEDDPSGVTEKAYKIRYLDATGQQTDEANCVHRAAFVGCTYHCG
jgi:hypothetical protein